MVASIHKIIHKKSYMFKEYGSNKYDICLIVYHTRIIFCICVDGNCMREMALLRYITREESVSFGLALKTTKHGKSTPPLVKPIRRGSWSSCHHTMSGASNKGKSLEAAFLSIAFHGPCLQTSVSSTAAFP